MQYLSYQQSEQIPNIVVDGASNARTELALSHWPNSTTPRELQADLSAEIVFNYLANPQFKVTAQVVSNNHFDADRLVGIYTLLNPADAEDLKELLIDIAGAGDFNVYKDREAARISFILDAWQNPRLSPLKASIFSQDYPTVANILYEELLPRFSPDRLPAVVEPVATTVGRRTKSARDNAAGVCSLGNRRTPARGVRNFAKGSTVGHVFGFSEADCERSPDILMRRALPG